jgi:hypothetical protein
MFFHAQEKASLFPTPEPSFFQKNPKEQVLLFQKLPPSDQRLFLEYLLQEPQREAFFWELWEKETLAPESLLCCVATLLESPNSSSAVFFRVQQFFHQAPTEMQRIASALFLTLKGSSFALDFLIQATRCQSHQYHFRLKAFLLEALKDVYIQDPFNSLSWDQQLRKWWQGIRLNFSLLPYQKTFFLAFQKVYLSAYSPTLTLPFCECELCSSSSKDIPIEEISYTYQGQNQFKGRVAFSMTLQKRTLKITLRIALRTNPQHPLSAEIKNQWKTLIEQIWSDRYYLQGTSSFPNAYNLNERFNLYQVHIEVVFTEAPPYHHEIQVAYSPRLSGDQGLWNIQWALGDPRFRNAPAHEVGHIFGNFDEYPQGATHPNNHFKNVPNSIMGIKMSKVYPRHYEVFRHWISLKQQIPFEVVEKNFQKASSTPTLHPHLAPK